MQLVVVGATGATGQELLQECLSKGHRVTALVRNPDKLTLKHENLTITKANIFDEDELAGHLAGCDALLSCMGSYSILFMKCSLYTDSIKVFAAAMRKAGVKRFVSISAWGSQPDPNHHWFIRWFGRPLLLHYTLPDLGAMEDYLTDTCGDLDYTTVLPAQLTYAKASGKEIMTSEGNFVPDATMKIPRRDVANFMLKCLVEDLWKKKHVAIGIK